MEQIKATTGRTAGQVSITKTIQTMGIGEIWSIDSDSVKLENIRVSCAKVHAATDMRFSVLGPCFDNANIRIIRIK